MDTKLKMIMLNKKTSKTTYYMLQCTWDYKMPKNVLLAETQQWSREERQGAGESVGSNEFVHYLYLVMVSWVYTNVKLFKFTP